MDKPRRAKLRKLIVPVVLTVTTVSTAVLVATASVGCDGEDKPPVDAGVGDVLPDTPII